MLHISGELGEFGRELFCYCWWIGQPEILVGFEPAETVADYDTAADILGLVWSRSMDGGAEKADRIAGLANSYYGNDETFEIVDRLPVRPGVMRVAPMRRVNSVSGQMTLRRYS